jgi:hypothetical protein
MTFSDEATRALRIKYGRDIHHAHIGARVPKVLADKFRAVCKANGISMNEALTLCIEKVIKAEEARS